MNKTRFLLIFLLLLALKLHAQKDSSYCFFAGIQAVPLNSFQEKAFLSEYQNSSSRRFITSFNAGYLMKSRTNHLIWSGFIIKYKIASEEALSRSYPGTYGDFGRYYSTVFYDKLGLNMIDAGFIMLHAFRKNSCSGFYLNPDLVIGIMHQSLKREFDLDIENSKGMGYDISSGILLSPEKIVKIKIDLGYRYLKLHTTEKGILDMSINWSGFYLGAGIVFAI